MKNNVIFLVIDALSYWYIQAFKSVYQNSFFAFLEKESYYTTAMYSVGPFTEAALQGLLSSQHPLDRHNYMNWLYDSNELMLDVLQKNGYQVYIGGHEVHCCHFNADVWGYKTLDNFNLEATAESSIWRNRFKYFFELYDKGIITDQEEKILEDVIDFVFYCFGDREDAKKRIEYDQFNQNKKCYTENLLKLKDKHSFYRNFLDKEKIEAGGYARTINNIYHKLPSSKEAKICSEIEFRNKKRFIDINSELCGKRIIEAGLVSQENRCVQSNNDIITHMRGTDYAEPTMGREIKHFLNWLDERKESVPFFSWMHLFDFHYKENIMENDAEHYWEELCRVEEALHCLPDMKMSVSKTLSILHIEKELINLWKALEKRNFFDDSYLVITADHGISNFMYPADLESERWHYRKTLFNVPFYILGNGMKKGRNNELLTGMDVPVTLLDILGILPPKEYKGKNFLDESNIHSYVMAEWINECPNISRESVKFGIRDENYSLTYKTTLNEFIDSGECIALFDLQKDPEELVNLSNSDVMWKIPNKYFTAIRERWYELLLHYYLECGDKYFGHSRLKQLLKDNPLQIKKWLTEQSEFETERFMKEIGNRKVILFGVSAYAKKFIAEIELKIYEIWDNDVNKDKTYFMGHKVKLPYEISDNREDYMFIITDKQEMETYIQLADMHFNNIYIGKQIIKKLKFRG